MATEATPAVETRGVTERLDADSDGEYQVISRKSKPATKDTETSETEPHTILNEKVAVDELARGDMDMGEPKAEFSQSGAGDGGPVSDADWLRLRTNRVLDIVDDDEVPKPRSDVQLAQGEVIESSKGVAGETELPHVETTEAGDIALSEEDKIRQTGRLYLRNLPFNVTEEDLRRHFSKHGAIEEVSPECSFAVSLVVMNYQDRDN